MYKYQILMTLLIIKPVLQNKNGKNDSKEVVV